MIKKLFAFIVIFGVVTGIAYQLFTIQNNIAVVKPVEAPKTLTPPQPQVSKNQPGLVGHLPATQSDTGADLGENINNKGKDEALEQKTPQERIPFVRNLTPSDIVPIVTRPVVIIQSEPTPPAIVPPQATVITNDIDVISMTTTTIEPLPIAITPIVAEPIDVITDNTKIIDIIALETITPINIKMAMLTSEGKALAIEKIQVDKKDQGSISKLEIIKAGVSDEVIQAKEIISWHKNGEKRSSVIVKQGQKQGLETIWHDNATKSIETMYVDGVKNGETTQWNRQGEKTLSGNFAKGKLATATNYTYHDNHIQASKVGIINGLKHGEEVIYLTTGEKSAQSEYLLGVKDGVSVKWFKSGGVSSTEDYTKGQLNGTVQTLNEQGLILEQSYYVNGLKRNSVEWIYNADNQLISETNLLANAKNGLQTKWHDNTFKSSLGIFKSNKKQGIHTTWFDNKNKSTQGEYSNGNKQGLHSTWFENGILLSLENFKNNQHQGLQTHWNNQGEKTKELEYLGSIITRETSFLKGKRHGIETLRYAHGILRETQTYQEGDNVDISKWYDEQGRLLKIRNYQNKTLLSEILYSKGLRHGKARMFYPTSQTAREVDYVNGKKHGKQTHYRDDGSKDLEANYVNDVLDGLLTTYLVTGEVESATTYRADVRHGLRQVFYANGSIHNEETFAHGKRDGWLAWFYQNGYLDQAIYYSNGVRSDDKLEVYIPTAGGSIPMRDWLKANSPISHNKAYPNTTGLVISKNKMGEVDFIANYVMGIKQGLNITFHPNGRKKKELTWKDGIGGYVSNLTGKLTDWSEAGNKVYESYYKPNLASSTKASIWSDNKDNASGGYYKTTEYGAYLHGSQSYFDDQGQITQRLFWQNNQLQ